jgi:tetratricopeptide (TPR) repeat protein
MKKRSQLWIWVVLIVLVTAIAYSNSLENGFVAWDDDTHVYANQGIRNLDCTSIRLFFSNYYLKMYAPLTMVSYALDYKIGGPAPAIYHRTNLIIHLFNVTLVFYFLYRLTGQKAVAVIAALFFGIHPLHVESVAWISERKDLLYVFFYLGGLIAWIGRRDGKGPRTFYFLALFLFLLSLLSKSAAVTFPLILLLIDFYRRPHSREIAGKMTLKNHADKIPFFLLAIAFGILSLFSQKVLGTDVDYAFGYTILDRVFLGAYAFAFYLIKSVFPWKLSALHPMPMKSDGFLPVSYYISIIVLIGFVILLVKMIRAYMETLSNCLCGILRRAPGAQEPKHIKTYVEVTSTAQRSDSPAQAINQRFHGGTRQVSMPTSNHEVSVISKDILFGMLFFLFTILLILFIPVGSAVVAERYTYLPYIGIFMILGRLYLYIGRAGSKSRRHGLTAVVVVAVVLVSGMTFVRNRVWKDSMTLFSDVIEKNPDAGLAYNNRGNLRMDLKDLNGAMEDFNKAIELKYFDAYNNRGIIRNRLGDYKNALEDFNRAEQNIRWDKEKLLYNRGIAKLNIGDFKGAEEDFSGAIRINPRHANALSNRGLVRHEKLSDIEGAIQDFDEAIRLDPDDPYVYYNRGNAWLRSGKTDEALADYDRTIERAPQFAAAYFNRGLAFLQSGSLNAACTSWESAVKLGEKNAAELMEKYCQCFDTDGMYINCK